VLIHVGKVTKLAPTLIYVCACCGISLQNCSCDHDRECFDTSCPNRKSSY